VWLDDTDHDTLVGALSRVINAVEATPRRVRDIDAAIVDHAAQLERTRAARGTQFPHIDELHDVRRRAAQLRATLEERYRDKDDRSTPALTTPATDAKTGNATEPSASGTDRVRRRLDELASRPQPPDLAR
jgi:hypothetical protein